MLWFEMWYHEAYESVQELQMYEKKSKKYAGKVATLLFLIV